MKYFEKGDLTIFHEDITKIQDIPENSVNLIVTSPPYNLKINYDSLTDDMPYPDYLVWSAAWMAKIYDLAKTDGRFCLNIPMETSQAGEIRTIGMDLINVAKKVGWQYKFTIIWDKTLCPKMSRGVFMEAYSPLIAPRYEIIIVFYKDKWTREERLDSDLTKEEYFELSESVWRFTGRHNPDHPAVFPILLAWRCIKLFSFIGDTVLEPFLGSGTTLVAASLLNRKGIGTDISENYCSISKQRIFDQTKEGKRKLLEEAGIEYSDQDGRTNKELIDKMKIDRKKNTVRIHGIKRFLK